VHADIAISGEQDTAMEQVLAYIGLEPGISAISWRTLSDDEE